MGRAAWQRTHTCGELRASDIGREVVLNGWVKRRRDLGNLIFIDVRDRAGVTQVIVDPSAGGAVHAAAKEVRTEYVVSVRGTVRSRGAQVNREMATGEIEVLATALTVLNSALTPPFPLDDTAESDDVRLAQRYLDLRRPHLTRALGVRHRIALAVRECLDKLGFWEIETPMLTKSTPEGARDYLVPSRVHPGQFFALPQSPQLMKQLLMMGGMERYFQITRCFRDEDLRADRQPEFTQVDLEMSFATQEDVFDVTEQFVQAAFAAGGVEIQRPFPRLTYQTAMERYGTDKPDLRYGLAMEDLTAALGASGFNAFQQAAQSGGRIIGLRVSGGAALTRKQLDELNDVAAKAGAKGVLTVRMEASGERKSSLMKFLSEKEWAAVDGVLGLQRGDAGLIVADAARTAQVALGSVRQRAAEMCNLVSAGSFALAWITDFPLFAYDKDEQRWVSEHHPFTAPAPEDLAALDSNPAAVRSCSYDLVINGYETASGSVRIHEAAIQQKIFELLELQREEIEARFGFFIEALKYGAPPHAGIAVGLDRLVMLILGYTSLRDVIAFPKTQKAVDLMTGAPSAVRAEQLKELHIECRAPAAAAE